MNKPRYVVQWDAQPVHFCKTMCSLLESQILVDMTVISNSYSIKVHKCIMAANSPYFREQLLKEPSIDKVVMNGVKHSVLKALIEFIYCGETSVYEDNIHELIAVANYFQLRGLKAILPHKIGIICNENKELLLQIKPPVFFCKNEKIRSVRHNSYVSDLLYGEEDVKVVLDGSNYQVFDSTKRQLQSTSVVDGAHVALAKEEAASRFALQMLQKDLNVNSNLFVIEDTCTEATVETSLTTQFEDSNSLPPQDPNIIQNNLPEPQNSLASLSEAYKLPNLENKMEKTEKLALESAKDNKCTEKIKECLQMTLQSDLPNDFPILYKSNDGNYINVTSEIFKNLAQSGAIHYQVVHEDGHIGDYQQYICNNFSDINVNHEEMNKELAKENEPMTLKQLVAETVSSDFSASDKSYLDNINSNLATIISVPGMTSDHHGIVDDIPHHTNEEIVSDMSYNNFIVNDKHHITFVTHDNDLSNRNLCGIDDNCEENAVHDMVLSENISEKVIATPLKRKRGRPRKIKLESDVPIKMYETNKIIREKNLKILDETPKNYSLLQHFEEKAELFNISEEQKYLESKNLMENNYSLLDNSDNEISNKNEKETIIDNENGQEENQNEEIKDNPLFNLMSLNKDIPFAVGLQLNKILKSPKTKRRCTRSSNKENILSDEISE